MSTLDTNESISDINNESEIYLQILKLQKELKSIERRQAQDAAKHKFSEQVKNIHAHVFNAAMVGCNHQGLLDVDQMNTEKYINTCNDLVSFGFYGHTKNPFTGQIMPKIAINRNSIDDVNAAHLAIDYIKHYIKSNQHDHQLIAIQEASSIDRGGYYLGIKSDESVDILFMRGVNFDKINTFLNMNEALTYVSRVYSMG